MELVGWKRKKSVLITALCTFLFGVPSALSNSNTLFKDWKKIYGANFLDTIDLLVSNWIIPICGFLTAIFIGWVMDKNITRKEFALHSKWHKFWKTWNFFMRYIIPVLIVLIILQEGGVVNFDNLFRK